MGLSGWLAGLAAGADVPVFTVVGAGGRLLAQEAALLPGVRVVDTPRAANLLLVTGRITAPLLRPLLSIHDQLPTPRATVRWISGSADDGLASALPGVVAGRPGDGGALQSVFRELVSGARPSDPPALADEEPGAWRGVGPYGQGGTGMTGGVPYGRPLAARAPDPDGLELDQLPLHVGPIYPPLPPGLVLDVGLQGDVIREVTVGTNPFAAAPDEPVAAELDTALFIEALTGARSVAELELARTRHHLRWAAATLRLHGLDSLGLRLLAMSRSPVPEQRCELERLVRRLRRSRSLAWATRGIGTVLPEQVDAGPVARAAGRDIDARLADPAYGDLGFAPVVVGGGDAWARLQQRLAEAVQSLELAARAGTRVRQPGPTLEGPRGPLRVGEPLPSRGLLDLLADLLVGREWGDAMTTVASLDLDVEEAAYERVATPAGTT